MYFSQLPKLFLISFVFLIFCNPLFSQKLDPKGRDEFKPDHIIKSEITNKEYLIHMSFPKNYSIQDSITYPVLYVLDGKSTFGYFKSSYIDYEKIEDVILVGISHKANGIKSRINRFIDYTPYRDSITEKRIEKKFGVCFDSCHAFVSGYDLRTEEKVKETFEEFDKHFTPFYQEEIRYGRSLFGAHLDDFVINFKDKKSRLFASRGQQKLIVSLLKIAQVTFLASRRGPSLFLLDDFMTDLDENRAQLFLPILDNLEGQVFFTSPLKKGHMDSLLSQKGAQKVLLTI